MSVSFIREVESAPAIDILNIKEMFAALRTVSGALDVEFDPITHEAVQTLFITAVSGGDDIRCGLVRLMAVLQANSLTASLEARLKQAQGRDTEEKRETGLALVWQYITREINGIRASLDQVADSLVAVALSLEQQNLGVRAEVLITRSKVEFVRINEAVATQRIRQQQLLSDSTLVDETIQALDLVKRKDLRFGLPTAEEAETLIQDATKVELVKEGIKRLEKLLDTGANGISYVQAIHQRDELRAARNSSQAAIQRLDDDLHEEARQQRCLGTVLTLQAQKQALGRELLQVPTLLQQYSLGLMMSTEARDFDALVKRVEACTRFVESAYAKLR